MSQRRIPKSEMREAGRGPALGGGLRRRCGWAEARSHRGRRSVAIRGIVMVTSASTSASAPHLRISTRTDIDPWRLGIWGIRVSGGARRGGQESARGNGGGTDRVQQGAGRAPDGAPRRSTAGERCHYIRQSIPQSKSQLGAKKQQCVCWCRYMCFIGPNCATGDFSTLSGYTKIRRCAPMGRISVFRLSQPSSRLEES
jgi:hypothetical protein